MPPWGAVITCSIFIASTTAICWPWRTSSPTATSMATMVPWIGEATPAEPSGPVGATASSSTCAVACSAFTWRVVREQREWIATLDPGPGEPAIVGRGPRRLHERGAADPDRRRPAWPCARRPSACGRCPAAKSACARMLRRNAMLVATPSSRNSLRARDGPRHGPREVRRLDDDLGEQRVERAAGAVARIAEPIGPHARSARRLVDRQRAAAGPHRAVRPDRFHVHARLDRVATRSGDPGPVQPQVFQRRALRQPDLGLHEIDAGHRLGDRVLDLQSRVRLDEDEGLEHPARPETSTRNSNVPRLV